MAAPTPKHGGLTTGETDEWYRARIAEIAARQQFGSEDYSVLEGLSLHQQLQALRIVETIRDMIAEGRRSQKH